jgi:hypothetical protein
MQTHKYHSESWKFLELSPNYYNMAHESSSNSATMTSLLEFTALTAVSDQEVWFFPLLLQW